MTSKPFRTRKSALDALIDRFERDDRPMSAMIEIADRCNEVCVHCYQVQGQKGEMSTAQVFTVIDELAAMGVLFLTLSGGEATLRPDFVPIVEHARKRGFVVKLYTNGLTMTEALARRLGELAVQEVQISLYSHRAEVHDWITRVPGSFDKTTDAVRRLRAEGVYVLVKTPLMAVNASAADREGYVALVESLDADWAFDPGIDGREDGDRSPEALAIDEAQLRDAFSDPRLARPSTGPLPAKPLDAGVCGACRGNVHVEPNGEVRPCTSLAVPLGNASVEGVRASFVEGENARLLRGLTWGDLHGCRDCELRAYCSRCFANGLRESGDALGPYARACSSARVAYSLALGAEPTIDARGLDPRVGPYRVEGHTLVRIDDVIDDADRALATRAPYLQRAQVHEAPAPIRPGELVQIRRPGKKATIEQIPSGTKHPEG